MSALARFDALDDLIQDLLPDLVLQVGHVGGNVFGMTKKYSGAASDAGPRAAHVLAQRILTAFQAGDLSIDNYDEDNPGQNLQLVVDCMASNALRIDMKPVPPEKALAIATDFAFTVGTQAHSRQCRVSAKGITIATPPVEGKDTLQATETARDAKQDYANKRMKASDSQTIPSGPAPKTVVKPLPSANNAITETVRLSPLAALQTSVSKANPAKVKRIAKKMQFESDEE